MEAINRFAMSMACLAGKILIRKYRPQEMVYVSYHTYGSLLLKVVDLHLSENNSRDILLHVLCPKKIRCI